MGGLEEEPDAIWHGNVLPISRDYFGLRKPPDRRFLRACAEARISLEKLQKKCGSRIERRFFRHHVRQTVQTYHLPDYPITLDNDFVALLKPEAEAGQQKPSAPSIAQDLPPAAWKRLSAG